MFVDIEYMPPRPEGWAVAISMRATSGERVSDMLNRMRNKDRDVPGPILSADEIEEKAREIDPKVWLSRIGSTVVATFWKESDAVLMKLVVG